MKNPARFIEIAMVGQIKNFLYFYSIFIHRFQNPKDKTNFFKFFLIEF
jgi:hypothetical protein